MFSIGIRPLHGGGARCRSLWTPLSDLATLSTARSVQPTSRLAWPKGPSARHSSSLKKPPTDPTNLLAQQRLRRPVSPHLSIYRPQITWIVSVTTRITGLALSGGLYLYATAYLLSPVTGWNIGSESLVAAFSGLSPVTQFAVKFGVALPFAFHSFNGIRHLVWDSGRMLTNSQVSRSGWTVVGSSIVIALLLAAWKPSDEA
ncbi:hypothetical protein BDW68DRAFT_15989 [Aspergillus falconensis]